MDWEVLWSGDDAWLLDYGAQRGLQGTQIVRPAAGARLKLALKTRRFALLFPQVDFLAILWDGMMRAMVADAIYVVSNRIRWNPGSTAIRLQKRRRRGHLSPEATLTDYERIILSAVSDPTATVYL